MSNLTPTERAAISLHYGDYLRFSQLMQDRFGLAFPEKRRMELEIGVRRAFAASTCKDIDGYYSTLLDPAHGAIELERLVNFLTIGESHFFRDAGQFDALVNTVLPEIIERRRMTRTLRVWSAGCASGEEPYSIAILLRDMLPDIEHWNITILGTDINTQHLERARRAVYGEWAFREARAKKLRELYFTQRGTQYELNPVIRRMVHFTQINLSDDRYPSYETNTMFMDLILCRNVTIYFPEAVTRMVVDRFYNSLTDTGWFIIGHSEHSLDIYKRFHPRSFPDAILYQRGSEPPPAFPTLGKTATFGTVEIPAFSPINPVVPVETQKTNPTRPDSSPLSSHPAVQKLNDFEQAQTLLSFGQIDQARVLLQRWVEHNQSHAPACALLGKIYADLGNWQEAERWCKLATIYDHLSLEAYYTLALVYQHQGQPEQAVNMMKKVIYIDRNDILGHFSMADLCHTSGQHAMALKYLENARKLLQSRQVDDLVPRSGDITVGRLAETVIELQQTWGAASAGSDS